MKSRSLRVVSAFLRHGVLASYIWYGRCGGNKLALAARRQHQRTSQMKELITMAKPRKSLLSTRTSVSIARTHAISSSPTAVRRAASCFTWTHTLYVHLLHIIYKRLLHPLHPVHSASMVNLSIEIRYFLNPFSLSFCSIYALFVVGSTMLMEMVLHALGKKTIPSYFALGAWTKIYICED